MPHASTKSNYLAQAQHYMQVLGMRQTIFSYTLEAIDHIKQGVILYQEKTGLSAHITCPAHGVHGFCVRDSSTLSVVSEALYDAALLELVMHALGYVLFVAHAHHSPQYRFQLPVEDAGILLEFDRVFEHSLFSDVYYTPRRDYIVFEISRRLEAETHTVDTLFSNFTQQLSMGLWRMQKNDKYVRHFLQEGTLPDITKGAHASSQSTCQENR